MSKLAAVRTGQPTQGAGTVPTPASSIPDLDPVGAALSPGSDVAGPGSAGSAAASLSPRDPYSAVRAASTAAWLSLTATELEVRKYFRTLPVASGLEVLAKMRKQCDLAAGELQNRIDDGNTERCTGCGKTLEEARKTQFILQGADVDPETGLPMPYRFCGPLCVRERNREKMLPKEERNKLRFDGREMGDIG